MLNLSESAKIRFMKDGANKMLMLSNRYSSIDSINFYCGDIIGETLGIETNLDLSPNTGRLVRTNSEPYLGNFDKVTTHNICDTRSYVCISLYVKFDNFQITAPSQFKLNLSYFTNTDRTSWTEISKTLNVSDFNNTWGRVSWVINNSNYYGPRELTINAVGSALKCRFQNKNYQIEYGNNENELPRDMIYNQADMLFDFECFNSLPMSNGELERESFSLTESLCSQDNIKFGLCESAHCNFTIVNKNINFNNQNINPVISIPSAMTDKDIAKINFCYDQSGNYHAGDTWTESRTIDNSSYLWTSQWLIYTDIASYAEYFNNYIYAGFEFKINNYNFDATPTYFKLGFVIEAENRPSIRALGGGFLNFDNFLDYKLARLNITYDRGADGKITQVTRPYLRFYDENQNELAVTGNINISIKEIGIFARLDNNTYPEYDVDNCMVENGTLDEYVEPLGQVDIPLGLFTVTDVKTEHTNNLLKKKITAYDNLVNLEANVADWYTSYMFGFNTLTSPSGTEPQTGLMWTRQIYSAFFNIAKTYKIDSRANYSETIILPETELKQNNSYPYIDNLYSTWSDNNGDKIRYSKFEITSDCANHRFVVDLPDNIGLFGYDWYGEYYWGYDRLMRGLMSANILVEETRDNINYPVNRYLVDSGDYFLTSPDCTRIKIYVPTCLVKNGTNGTQLRQSIKISRCDVDIKLTNGYLPLMYYNLSTKEIFACETSITGRDAVRSLLEPCGCFFRLSRERGLPEFVYCTRYGLYPSETLYPADDLYPRETVDGELLPLGRYMSLVADDYRVKNYGQIQIFRNDDTNDVKTVCEWQYTGDSRNDNVYIINDNIFYCNRNMYYDQSQMPQVQEMLENMFTAINNMGYVPNQVRAIGMPWIECGDRIGLLTTTSGVDSFIFRRTLSGIQMLVDNYEAVGDEYNNAIKAFKYVNKYM